MQLVLSNNRIIAHGENFIPVGGVIINTVNNKRYENATLAECSCLPSDIDEVGYEYHAGVFVPCAPYGKTENGVVLLACEECATPRSSGISIKQIAKWYVGSYPGLGTHGVGARNALTFEFEPQLLIISDNASVIFDLNMVNVNQQTPHLAVFVNNGNTSLANTQTDVNWTIWDGNKVEWYFARNNTAENFGAAQQMNTSGKTYYYIALG